jgi:hypothetical protein
MRVSVHQPRQHCAILQANGIGSLIAVDYLNNLPVIAHNGAIGLKAPIDINEIRQPRLHLEKSC